MLTANMTSTLIQILAHVDALWCPYRWHGHFSLGAATAIAERRAKYSYRGVPLVVSGTGTERLAGERELQRMAADGLIRLFIAGKRIGVGLTDHGDTYARKLSAGYTVRDSWHLLKLVDKTLADCGGKGNAGYVCETDILGTEYDAVTSPQLVGLENQSLPLLCRGYLESNCDVEGRVGYRVSEEGREACKPKAGKSPKFDELAESEYTRMYLAACRERETWQQSNPSHVTIPLSAGTWPRRASA